MASTPTPTLKCAQCGYENEPERVYCHNCGTKLDRSLLPKETVSRQESLKATRRRVKKMTNPGRGLAELKTGLSVLAWAALIAAVYLLLSPPGQLPSPQKEAEATLISVLISDAVDARQAASLSFTEADVSQHLRSRVKGASVIPGMTFKRAYGALGEGTITMGIQQELFGYPIYSTVEYRLTNQAGEVRAERIGQFFGRLGIDPRIPKLDAPFAKIWASLKPEQQLWQRAQAVTISKGKMLVVTKPTSP
jgi:hypothetical protein